MPDAHLQAVSLSCEDIMRFIQPKHKPMIMEPLKWNPSGLQPSGPYLIHKVTFMRTFSQYLTGFKNYHPSQIVEAMAPRSKSIARSGLGRGPAGCVALEDQRLNPAAHA